MTKKINNPIFDINNTTYSLSIQLSLNGFSFCVASLPENKVNGEGTLIYNYNENCGETAFTEFQLLQKITEAFDNKPELQIAFKKVHVIYHNELFALVPETVFDKNELKTYLNYSVKTLPTDYITYDNLSSEIVNVFIPYVNVNNYLLDKLGEFDFHHSSGILINSILEKEKFNTEKKVYLNISNAQFDLIAVKGTELLLFNSFKHDTDEDVLYYLLFCLEQLKLSPDTVNIELLNHVSENLYTLLYTYVRNIANQPPENESHLVIHKMVLQ